MQKQKEKKSIMHRSSGQSFSETKFYAACPPNLTVHESYSIVQLVLVKPSLERRKTSQYWFMFTGKFW